MRNFCVMCGAEIPDGGQVCSICKRSVEERSSDPGYWSRVCEIQRRQTIKGRRKYGQILEENVGMTPIERLEAIEEELIDALMYIEHLKEIIPEEVKSND